VKLRILTGVPASGKSSIAAKFTNRIRGDWQIVHWDDSIGPLRVCYGPAKIPGPYPPFDTIRGFHPFFAGWSAGWYLADGWNVFLEGHILDGEERARLQRAVKDVYSGTLDLRVAYIEVDLEEAIRRRVASRYWHPELKPPAREPTIRNWITTHVPTADAYDVKIDGSRPLPDVLKDVISVLEIDLEPL
jgi:chloramphenicol 3-O-phosphotransferase